MKVSERQYSYLEKNKRKSYTYFVESVLELETNGTAAGAQHLIQNGSWEQA